MLRTAMKIQKTSYHGSHEFSLKSQKLLELAVNTQDCAKKIGDLFCKRVFPNLHLKIFGQILAQIMLNYMQTALSGRKFHENEDLVDGCYHCMGTSNDLPAL